MMEMRLHQAGAGRPLVLMGGGLTGCLSWEPHEAELAATRRVVRPQLLSVQAGLEGAPLPAGYSIRMESQALARALQRAGVDGPVDLVAWSFGGVVVLDHALDHPALVRTLTLIEPPAFWALADLGQADARAAEEWRAMQALHAEMGAEVTEDQLARFALQAGFCPPGTDPRRLPAWPLWSRHRQSLRNGPALFAHRDRADRLRAFAPPVLVVKGTGSAHFLHRVADALASAFPRARSLELPSGHAPHVVSRAEFLTRLAAFQAE